MLRYDTGKVYHHLCGDQAVVQWAGAVWSSKSIPRHSFHSWLVVLDRNPTRDRLLSWGLQVSHLCLRNQKPSLHGLPLYIAMIFGLAWLLSVSFNLFATGPIS
ncbi:hypothetical protein F2Q68_00006907 [Brassica cretica]|uniref:Reverse transcriptase zinc-binding domain-containing protein n=1 Tax=Brassica cretica TaxID=69181 RepID=A0A8S9JCS1_BRACR|nr:hypothetical protein F2Q68_00006907 [Brassica cretica]